MNPARNGWEYVRDGAVNLPFGKTENARRVIPLSERAAAMIEAANGMETLIGFFPRQRGAGTLRNRL